jgi:hypothetical protein
MTASAGFSAYGTKLTVGAGATEVKETTKIDVDLGTVDDVDITNNNSADATEETVPGIIRTGVIDIEGNFVPTDTGQAALITALQARTDDLAIVVTCADSGDATFTGTGRVKSFKQTNPYSGKAGFTSQIKVKGKLTFAA